MNQRRQQREEKKRNSFQKMFDKRKAAVTGIAPSPIRELPDMLRELVPLSREDWGLYAFARENLRGKFSPEEKQALIRGAISCGQQYAREYRASYPHAAPQEIAKSLGLRVLSPEKPSHGGGQVMFACFSPPNEIQIYLDATTRAVRALEESEELRRILGEIDPRQVLIAHELFHYVEETHPDIYTETTKIDLRPLGIFHNHSKIICLGEIAAMAFAQELLGLPYSPYVFDIFLVYLYNKQTASNLFVQIKAIIAKGGA